MKSLLSKLQSKLPGKQSEKQSGKPKKNAARDDLDIEALGQYEAVLRKDERNLEALLQSAQILLKLERMDDFSRVFQSANNYYPGNMLLRKLGIRALSRSAAQTQVLAEWQKLLDEEPGDRDALLGIASALLALERPDELQAFLEQYDSLLNDVPAAAIISARCYTRQKLNDKIPDAWMRVVAIDPKQSEPYSALITFFLAEGRLEECAHWVKLASERFPRSPLFRLLKGRLGTRMQDDNLAEAGFAEAFERDNSNLEACLALVALFLKREAFEEADRWASLAVGLAPEDMRALTLRARVTQARARNAR